MIPDGDHLIIYFNSSSTVRKGSNEKIKKYAFLDLIKNENLIF